MLVSWQAFRVLTLSMVTVASNAGAHHSHDMVNHEVDRILLVAPNSWHHSFANIVDAKEELLANEKQWSPPGTFQNVWWTVSAALQTANQSVYIVTQASLRHNTLDAQHDTLCQA